MGLLHSRLTARRFYVEPFLPDDFQRLYAEKLTEFGFTEPPSVTKEEIEGWVDIHNMLKTDFTDYTWLNGSIAVFGFRTDKRSLPSARFKAEIEMRCERWREEHGVERIPAVVRAEIKEQITEEWLPRQMPKTSITEVAWNLNTDVLYFSSHGNGAAERLRRRFYRTFGRKISPAPPLCFVEDEEIRAALITTPPTRFGGAS